MDVWKKWFSVDNYNLYGWEYRLPVLILIFQKLGWIKFLNKIGGFSIMKQLGDVLLLDVILLVVSSLFGVGGFCLMLAVVIIYTVLWIGSHL